METKNNNYKNVHIIEVRQKDRRPYNRDNMYLVENYQLGSTVVSRCPLLNFKPICTIKVCNEMCKDNYKECYKYLGIEEERK